MNGVRLNSHSRPAPPALALRVFAFCCAVLLAPVCAAGSVPDFRVESGPAESFSIGFGLGMRPRPVFELPPVLASGTQRGHLLVTTNRSWACGISESIFSRKIPFDPKDCALWSLPLTIDETSGGLREEQNIPNGEYWRRNYNGLVWAVAVGERNFIGIAQGENKFERRGERSYLPTVNKKGLARCDLSPRSTYEDCWPSYAGFINIVSGPIGASEGVPFRTMPALWPATGYLDGAGRQRSVGLRGVSGFSDGEFLYVYYVDSSRDAEPGRAGGVCVARTRLTALSTDWPPVFVPFFNGAFDPGNPSMPTNVLVSEVDRVLEAPGGRASALWPNSRRTIRFSVAHLSGTALYVGLEEFAVEREWGIRLRLSSDLVHWTDGVPIPGEQGSRGWKYGSLHHPNFWNSAGTAQDEVDPSGFFIVGTRAGGQLVRRWVEIDFGKKGN